MSDSSKKIGVLIFPAGEVNSVELHDALSNCVNIRLYGASSYNRHGEYVFKNYTSGLPIVSDPQFIDAFNSLISKNKIDVVFPTHDTVAEFLSVHQSEIGAKIIVADTYTSEICRDKKKTFELFRDCNFCPIIYTNITKYPVFVKPRKGQGGIGSFVIKTPENANGIFDPDNMVICEFLPGEEFTVDCLTDKNGKLKGVFPRSRKRVLAGITVGGSTEALTEEILYIAKTINSRLHFLGLWYFQIKKSEDGQFKLLEISTRGSGTMCLTRARGINLPLLSVYTAMGHDIDVFCNDYNVTVDRTFIARYKIDYKYSRVYIDLDDTLVMNEKVCLNMIRFVYQCFNKGIPMTLLTRHACDHKENAEEYLKKCRIDSSLFDNIIAVPLNKEKSDFISPPNAIFIDNAFTERKKVYDRCKIPVFDVDCIEVLLDWKT